MHTLTPICLQTKAANAPAETGGGEGAVRSVFKRGQKALESKTEIEIELMKRTVQHILGAAVALAMTASGAFAQTVITSLPYPITQPGSYVLQPGFTVNQSDWAITITASNVDLNLNDQIIKINGTHGIFVHNDVNGPVDTVYIHDGTINTTWSGTTPPLGIYIYGLISNVNVTNVTFTGTNSDPNLSYLNGLNNNDLGSGDTFKNCTFSQMTLGGDGATVMKCTVVGNAFALQLGNPVVVSSGNGNSFKLNTVIGSIVTLSGVDTHQNNTLVNTNPSFKSAVTGGRQLGSQP